MKAKIVFITGASSGIGQGCARKFAKEGWNLILNARTVSKLEELKEELEKAYGVQVCVLPFDVRDRKQAAAALEALPEEWKSIDVLVNNAGLVIGVDKEFEGSLDEWDIMIDTNIRGLLAMTRLVVPGMVERGRGHIINIGRRCRLSRRQCLLCYQSCREGTFGRTPDRLGGYSAAGDEYQTGHGRNKLYSSTLSWRQAGG